MHEHVLAATFGRNEAETLAAVEKLHGTSSHLSLVLRLDCRRTHCAPDFTLFVLARLRQGVQALLLCPLSMSEADESTNLCVLLRRDRSRGEGLIDRPMRVASQPPRPNCRI